MRKIIIKHDMELYSLDKEKFTSQLDKISEDIKLIDVTVDVLDKNKSYCASNYKLWKYNVKKGTKGVFAVCGDKIVGRGWVKVKGSKDPYYNMGKNAGYVSGLFRNLKFVRAFKITWNKYKIV